MAFVLPSFSAAANYRLTPIAGGIAGPIKGFKDVKSTAFAQALKEANQLEYAAAAQAAGAGLNQLSAVQRQEMVNDATIRGLKLQLEAKEKERNTMTKPQRMAALANLWAPSGGGRQSSGGDLLGPLKQLSAYQGEMDYLDRSDAIRTAPFYNETAEFWNTMPAPPQPTKIDLPSVTKVTTPAVSPPELKNTPALIQAFEKSLLESIANQLGPNTTK